MTTTKSINSDIKLCDQTEIKMPLEKKRDKCSICFIIFTDENRIKHRTYCKLCRNEKRKRTLELNKNSNKFIGEKCSIILIHDIQVEGMKLCKSCRNQQIKESKIRNKENLIDQNKKYYKKNKEKIAEYYKEHYKQNKDIYLNNNKKWRNNNKAILNEKARIRCVVDDNYRIKRNLRNRLNICIKKNKSTMEYIGCDLDFLKLWLKSNFTKEMTFENYGSYWHIDHVIPCANFDMTNENDIFNCFRWTNLQPLGASKNMSKNNSINHIEIINHYNKVKLFAKTHNIILPDFNYNKYIDISI